MDFYGLVQDQTVNLSSGEPYLTPRLEGWLAACDLYDVPQHLRAHLIDMARVIFGGVHDRMHVKGLVLIDPAELADPALEGIDG